MSQAPAPAAEQWITPEEARKILGIKLRQLQQRARQGLIEKMFLPRRFGERQPRVRYSRADVIAVRNGTPNHVSVEMLPPEMLPPDQPPAQALSKTKKLTSKEALRIMGYSRNDVIAYPLPQLVAAPPAVETPKPWLTLEEAAAYSGLPAAFLLERARRGSIHALNVGQGLRARWRFSREGLRDLV